MEASDRTSRDERIDALRRAAIPVFAKQGYRRTSMADIAAAAGVSRPALYQYFDNRADLFRAALEAVVEDATDAALRALNGGGTIEERLDGYLQRAHADGYEALSATPHGAELLEVHHEFAADLAANAMQRARDGLGAFVRNLSSADAATTDEAIELLSLAPGGLKADGPSTPTYRRRLSVLARAAAGLLDVADDQSSA